MKKGILIGALAAGMTMGAGAAKADVVKVASGEELAAAIVAANSDRTIQSIKCVVEAGCGVTGALPSYTGDHPLLIDGKFSTIDASAETEVDAFSALGGGLVTLSRLTFVGGRHGIYVEVPEEKTGSQKVVLNRVTVRDSGRHGVYVNDGNYSIAGVHLFITASRFLNNGVDVANQEGVRVNETSKGMLLVDVKNSIFKGNAADGMSLNERGGGRVDVTLTDSKFLENGHNPLNPNDPEDGLDVDEFGPGDVRMTISGSRFNKNLDDGLDVDEAQGGTIYGAFVEARATNNGDQGITIEESKNGDIYVSLADSIVSDNDVKHGVDFVGNQQDVGVGVMTLDNVQMGDWHLYGMQMEVTP